MSKKRQHTCTVYRRKDKHGGGIMVNVISRKSKGRPFDVIELLMMSAGKVEVHARMSPDEALEVSTALSCATDSWLSRFGPYRKFRRRGTPRHDWGKGVAEVE